MHGEKNVCPAFVPFAHGLDLFVRFNPAREQRVSIRELFGWFKEKDNSMAHLHTCKPHDAVSFSTACHQKRIVLRVSRNMLSRNATMVCAQERLLAQFLSVSKAKMRYAIAG